MPGCTDIGIITSAVILCTANDMVERSSVRQQDVSVQLKGFDPDGDVQSYRASTVREAARLFGIGNRDRTAEVLDSFISDPEQYDKSLRTAGRALSHLKNLVSTGTFRVDGIDYGQRYLDRLEGFAAGSGFTPTEAVLLDMEGETGCQTLLIREKGNDRINIIHIEEEEDNPGLIDINRRRDAGNPDAGESRYPYRVVHLDDGGKKLTFFSYPGLPGGGQTVGINHLTGTVTMVDALFTKSVTEPGSGVWVNAVASMVLDIGDIDQVKILFSQLKGAGITYSGGYAIHMAQSGNPPRLISFEIGGPHTITVPPTDTPDRQITGQPSFPRSKQLQELDENYLSPGEKPPDEESGMFAYELARRKRRLELTGALVSLPDETINRRLDRLSRIAANPYGDIESVTDPDTGKMTGNMTGMPSLWSAGWAVGVVDQGVDVTIGKYQAPRIPGKEYGLTTGTANPKFVREDLLRIARKRMGRE